MRLNRFFVADIHDKWGPLKLDHQIWLNDKELVNQIIKVLRLKIGEQVILFDTSTERIYEIDNIEYPNSVHLKLVTELIKKQPNRHVYLLWALLKKDKNEWIIQKATELGIKNFVPILSDRSEKMNLEIIRAKRIIVEACEQCGRFDIPEIREPVSLKAAFDEYKDMPMFVCEKGNNKETVVFPNICGLLIGPEGGWSQEEKGLFNDYKLGYLNISDFVLRAETAAVIASALALLPTRKD